VKKAARKVNSLSLQWSKPSPLRLSSNPLPV
jgi:hypothetical protein